MNQLFESKFQEPMPLYRQVAERVRELIRSGDLPPGTRLPSTQELAARWQIAADTVQLGIQPLVKEGLLTRVPMRGHVRAPARGEADVRGGLRSGGRFP